MAKKDGGFLGLDYGYSPAKKNGGLLGLSYGYAIGSSAYKIRRKRPVLVERSSDYQAQADGIYPEAGRDGDG